LTKNIIWKVAEMKTTKPHVSRERTISRWNAYILQRNDGQPNEMYYNTVLGYFSAGIYICSYSTYAV